MLRGELDNGANRSVDRRILELFREREGVVSGAEIGSLLNISRTAVWKHISGLRTLGYRIEAQHACGYRLLETPDILTPAAVTADLMTDRLGCRVICLSETASTNLEANRLAEEGAVEGTVVIADMQTHGKGRLGRNWHSPAGINLYCSIVLRPRILPVAAFQLTFLSALAVARAVETESTLHPVIKWPNDILVNGQKVAGLLNEMSAETERVNFVILGIGVNLNMRREQFPLDLRNPASSLLIESGHEVNRLKFLRTLIKILDDLYGVYLREGYGHIREEWVARCGMIGSRVSVCSSSEQFEGVATDIDESGALLVERSSGIMARVLAGDVKIL